MMKYALSFFPLKLWPMAGLILFFVMFICVVLWVNRRGSGLIYSQVSQLPLEDASENLKGVQHE